MKHFAEKHPPNIAKLHVALFTVELTHFLHGAAYKKLQRQYPALPSLKISLVKQLNQTNPDKELTKILTKELSLTKNERSYFNFAVLSILTDIVIEKFHKSYIGKNHNIKKSCAREVLALYIT